MRVKMFPVVQRVARLCLFVLVGCTNVVHLEQAHPNEKAQSLRKDFQPGSYVATWAPQRTHDDVAAQLKALGAHLLVVSSERIILDISRALSSSELGNVQLSPYREPTNNKNSTVAESFQDVVVDEPLKPFRGASTGTKSTTCWNAPRCFSALQGRVGIVLFFAESVEGLWNGNEDWTTQEVEWESARYASELVGLARIAPPEANLSFEIFNLGPVNVNGEPSSGYSPYNALTDVIPALQNHFGLPIQIPSWEESVSGLYETVVAPASAALGLDSMVVIGVARDRVAPFSQVGQATSWWPHAILGGPFAVTSLSAVTEGRAVFTHELLHTFGALDQYATAPGFCELTTATPLNNPMVTRVQEAGAPSLEIAGHLHYIVNGNHDGCVQPGLVPAVKMSDIMKHVTATTSPHWRPVMSWYTRAQIGWGNTGAVDVRHFDIPLDAELVSPAPHYLIDGAAFVPAPQFSEQRALFKYLSKGIRKIATPTLYTILDSELGDSRWQRKNCSNDVLVDSGPNDIDASGQNCSTTACEGRIIAVVREYEWATGSRVSLCSESEEPANSEL